MKNVGTKLDWSIGTNSSGADETDTYLPNLVLASSLVASLGNRPLIWNLDCRTSIYGDSVQSFKPGRCDVFNRR